MWQGRTLAHQPVRVVARLSVRNRGATSAATTPGNLTGAASLAVRRDALMRRISRAIVWGC